MTPSAPPEAPRPVGSAGARCATPGACAQLGQHGHELKCEAALDVRKIDEAMGTAEHLGLAFCEATELYSGMEGNLN